MNFFILGGKFPPVIIGKFIDDITDGFKRKIYSYGRCWLSL